MRRASIVLAAVSIALAIGPAVWLLLRECRPQVILEVQFGAEPVAQTGPDCSAAERLTGALPWVVGPLSICVIGLVALTKQARRVATVAAVALAATSLIWLGYGTLFLPAALALAIAVLLMPSGHPMRETS